MSHPSRTMDAGRPSGGGVGGQGGLMGRYHAAVCRLCRREGMKLYLKGEKCYTDKCPVAKDATPPGMHGPSRRKPSDFAIRLREKQRARRFYGAFEGQFKRYFKSAARAKEVTEIGRASCRERG